MNFQTALNNLKTIDQTLRSQSVPYWLTDGTLLGLVREKNFIGHDLDTDIGIMFRDFTPAALTKLIDQGFKVLHYFGYPEDSFEIALARDGVKTDLFFFYERDDTVYHCAFMRQVNRIDYVYPRFDLTEETFLGHKFPIPANPEQYVETKYGANWRVPVTPWDWAYSPVNHVKTPIKIDLELQKQKVQQWLQS